MNLNSIRTGAARALTNIGERFQTDAEAFLMQGGPRRRGRNLDGLMNTPPGQHVTKYDVLRKAISEFSVLVEQAGFSGNSADLATLAIVRRALVEWAMFASCSIRPEFPLFREVFELARRNCAVSLTLVPTSAVWICAAIYISEVGQAAFDPDGKITRTGFLKYVADKLSEDSNGNVKRRPLRVRLDCVRDCLRARQYKDIELVEVTTTSGRGAALKVRFQSRSSSDSVDTTIVCLGNDVTYTDSSAQPVSSAQASGPAPLSNASLNTIAPIPYEALSMIEGYLLQPQALPSALAAAGTFPDTLQRYV